MNYATTLAVIVLCLAAATLRAEPPATAPATTQPGHVPDTRAAEDKVSHDVAPEKFDQLRRATDKTVVLDVRTPDEFKRGHLPGAVNVDIYAKDFDARVVAMDREQTYLIYCAQGGRGGRACDKMEKLSFPHLYNLDGGIKAWQRAGKPVEK